jgi:tetratricopeptide (TPR) repeat protein
VIKHALTREVAYESLPRARRARMHAAFAEWLERRGRDEFASFLAHHYARAVRHEDADLAWAGDERSLEHLRAKALLWLEAAAELAMRRYEIEDALELLHEALSVRPDEEAQARVWLGIGKAEALRFDGEAFRAAMENSLVVCSNKATCADTYSELAFQTAIRSSMWRRRPDRELVASWIDHALKLSEQESASRAKALIARSFWDRNTPDDAREASELAERVGDAELRSYALGARGAVAFGSGDFESALRWSQRRLGLLPEITDPDHVADAYELAIPSFCATTHFAEARRLAAEHDAVVERLSAHHRVHGISVQLEVEEACGGWDRILELADRMEAAVEANLSTPCIRNARCLLVTALAASYAGDDEAARRYERRAGEIATEGYDFALAAPRTWLALVRGAIDDADGLDGVDLVRGQTWYALPAAAARLDALSALMKRSLVERDAPPLLRPGTYLEPFALRALGIVREDTELIERAIERFDAIGLEWHAQQTRSRLART